MVWQWTQLAYFLPTLCFMCALRTYFLYVIISVILLQHVAKLARNFSRANYHAIFGCYGQDRNLAFRWRGKKVCRLFFLVFISLTPNPFFIAIDTFYNVYLASWRSYKQLLSVVEFAILKHRPEAYYDLDSVLRRFKSELLSPLRNPVGVFNSRDLLWTVTLWSERKRRSEH